MGSKDDRLGNIGGISYMDYLADMATWLDRVQLERLRPLAKDSNLEPSDPLIPLSLATPPLKLWGFRGVEHVYPKLR